MEYRLIKSPSQGTIDILMRRRAVKNADPEKMPQQFDAVGLVQGRMIEMVSAADIAEKAAGVIAEDIRGNCPQSMILLALFGDIASVETALLRIRQNEKEERETW